MNKIWLKSPNGEGQCCDCENRNGPCDSCGKMFCATKNISNCYASSQSAFSCALSAVPGFWNYNTTTWSPGQPFPPPGWTESWAGPYLATTNGFPYGPTSNWIYTFLTDKKRKFRRVSVEGDQRYCSYNVNYWGQSCYTNTLCYSDIKQYDSNSYWEYPSNGRTTGSLAGTYKQSYNYNNKCNEAPSATIETKNFLPNITLIGGSSFYDFYILDEKTSKYYGPGLCWDLSSSQIKYMGEFTTTLSKEWTRDDTIVSEVLSNCCQAEVAWTDWAETDECSSSPFVYAKWQMFLKGLQLGIKYRFEMPYYVDNDIYSKYTLEFEIEEEGEVVHVNHDIPMIKGRTVTAKKWSLTKI